MTASSFRGVPSFFRASCRDASSRRHGLDYSNAGRSLAEGLRRLVPDDAEQSEWELVVEQVELHLEKRRWSAAIAWFVDHYPACMSLVPARRRSQFLLGVLAWQIADRDECDQGEEFNVAREILRKR